MSETRSAQQLKRLNCVSPGPDRLDQQWTGGRADHSQRPGRGLLRRTGAPEVIWWVAATWNISSHPTSPWGFQQSPLLSRLLLVSPSTLWSSKQKSCQAENWTWPRWRSRRSAKNRSCRPFWRLWMSCCVLTAGPSSGVCTVSGPSYSLVVNDCAPWQHLLIYRLSCPFKEPGGHRLPAGCSGDALPGPHQAAWARVREGGGRQGKAIYLFIFTSL